MNDESCNLPNYCECSLCRHWGENGWDLGRTPSWQYQQTSLGESNDWEVMEEGEEY